MKYRKFGSTGFKVSALGLGCMRLPTKKLMPLQADIPKSIKLIRSAVDKGINYIDTAWVYHFGASEKIVGSALQDGYRNKVHLVTKSPLFLVSKTEDFDKYLNKQLKKLHTDYIDSYLFHSMNRSGLEKLKKYHLMDKMVEAKKEGKIKYIGFSFHDTLPVFKEVVDYYPWDVVQIQYNYMDTAIQATTEGLKYAAGKGMAVVIMEPLKGGRLANPPAEAWEVMERSKIKRSPVDWALQYLWNLPEVSVVLSGMGNMQMLNENCDSADRSGVNSLDEEDLNIIDDLIKIYREKILVPCTSCRYCLPCPSGVNIPQNFAILNNLALERSNVRKWLQKRDYKKMANSSEKLNQTKSNGSASLCINCGVCLEKCPQEINIPDELKNVHLILKKGKKISAIYKDYNNK
ncbi:MAG: aldo/keto reductase [Candidatus Atribacteria bacterium]|nr:MAG: aldo/keto reductase [Candidatus Atribacteria bacterium]